MQTTAVQPRSDAGLHPVNSAGDARRSVEPNTVLVVEDDAATSRPLRALLAHYGWQAYVAETIADANAYLDAHLPEVVLLDLMLPDGDGTEILRRVQEQQLKCRVTVVTAAHESRLMRSVAGFKPWAILKKPMELMELLSLLKQPHVP